MSSATHLFTRKPSPFPAPQVSQPVSMKTFTKILAIAGGLAIARAEPVPKPDDIFTTTESTPVPVPTSTSEVSSPIGDGRITETPSSSPVGVVTTTTEARL
ncbi:hypothetical protein ACCO45_006700 [Purpureocillium lilacinum]|uniref:Uncharacterized protein n=1 Tax=Purpureocillium lilacinum TaxID=33203 RepID=A0ACC4DTB6_PURLI